MSTIKRCAACGKQSPVSTMKTCMHAEMHNYVCDSKCMSDFYNPPKKPAPSLPAAGSAGEEPTPVMIQAACAAFRMDVSPMQAMQAALRAALSAQQSAPELHQSVQELKNFRGEK